MDPESLAVHRAVVDAKVALVAHGCVSTSASHTVVPLAHRCIAESAAVARRRKYTVADPVDRWCDLVLPHGSLAASLKESGVSARRISALVGRAGIAPVRGPQASSVRVSAYWSRDPFRPTPSHLVRLIRVRPPSWWTGW